MTTPRLVGGMLLASALWSMVTPNLFAQDGKKKLPVPSADAQAAAMKLVKEVYWSDYTKAESLTAKQALARRLVEDGKGTKDDLPGRFVMLKLAGDVATQGLDGLTAYAAVDTLAETFEIDPVEMKASVLTHGASHAKQVQDHKHLMDAALKLVDAAIAEDNYGVAKRLCELTASEAEGAREPQTRDLAIKRGAEVEKVLAVLYESAQNATGRLNTDPTNPAANTAVGKYLCFVKGDWENGVLMLALGNDEALKALAQSELIELSSQQPEQLGDDWWEQAEKQQGFVKNQTRARAAYWYRRALPRLTGLAQARVEKRLDSLVEQQPSVAIQPSAVQSSVVQQPAAVKPALGEHSTWTVPFWTNEPVRKTKTVSEVSPGGGYRDRQVTYTDMVKKYHTKTVQAKLDNYEYKTGDVLLKITVPKEGARNGETEEVVRKFRYTALGKEDRKYLDAVKKQLMGQ